MPSPPSIAPPLGASGGAAPKPARRLPAEQGAAQLQALDRESCRWPLRICPCRPLAAAARCRPAATKRGTVVHGCALQQRRCHAAASAPGPPGIRPSLSAQLSVRCPWRPQPQNGEGRARGGRACSGRQASNRPSSAGLGRAPSPACPTYACGHFAAARCCGHAREGGPDGLRALVPAQSFANHGLHAADNNGFCPHFHCL
jgi:hypothetical protein